MTGEGLDRAVALIRDVPDHPAPGVLFKDITPVLADGPAFAALIDALTARAVQVGAIDLVAGVEARGFVLGAPVARALGVGFVPVRKEGKLPWRRISASYELEYGAATVEVHEDAFASGARTLVVDDVLATGGTAGAALELVRRGGGVPAAFLTFVEIGFLDGRSRLQGERVEALVRL